MGIILFQKVGGGWDLNFDVKYGIDAWFISCNKNTYCRLLVRKKYGYILLIYCRKKYILFLQGRMLQRSEAQSRFALYEEEEKGEQTFYLQYLAL